jgi:hypothetical protein
LINALSDAGLYSHSLSPLLSSTSNISPAEKCSLINQFYRLYNAHQSSQTQLSTLSDRCAVSQSEISSLQNKLSDCKESLADKDRQNFEISNRKLLIDREFSAFEKKTKLIIAELDKKNVQISSKEKQYRHEMRKLELDNEKLREKLSKLINEANKPVNKGLAIEISNNLAKTTQSRAKWAGTGHSERELLEKTIENLQSKLNSSQAENELIKAALHSVEKQLNEALSTGNSPISPTISAVSQLSAEQKTFLALEHCPAPLHLPFTEISPQFQADFSSKLAQLVQKLADNSAHSALLLQNTAQNSANEEFVAQLQGKIRAQLELLAEQQQIIQFQTFSTANFSAEFEEQRRLSDVGELQLISHRISKEKHENSAELVKICVEKGKLEAERQSFAQEKANFYAKHGLQLGLGKILSVKVDDNEVVGEKGLLTPSSKGINRLHSDLAALGATPQLSPAHYSFISPASSSSNNKENISHNINKRENCGKNGEISGGTDLKGLFNGLEESFNEGNGEKLFPAQLQMVRENLDESAIDSPCKQ